MAKLTALEQERLEVAEAHFNRFVSLYKSKPRKGRGLDNLKMLETISNWLTAMRIKP
jgi:hypothetical protein